MSWDRLDVLVKRLRGSITGATNLSMTTARLLGRTTAGSGAVEEISVGSGLSLSAGSLAATGAGLAVSGRIAGRYYYGPFSQAGSLGAITVAKLYAQPYYIGSSASFDRIAVAVTGVASSFVRLGMYTDNSGKPDTLVFDSGQIDTSTLGIKEYTISQTRSGWVWVAAVAQTNSANFVRLAALINPMIGTTSPYAEWPGMAYSQTGVTGAMPSSWGSTYTNERTANTVPAVSLRAS